MNVCYGPIYGINPDRNYLKIEIKVNGFFLTDLGINNFKVYAKMRYTWVFCGDGGCGDLHSYQ